MTTTAPSIRRSPRSTRALPTLRYGDRVGDYIINGFAGQGATSFVYQARHVTSFAPVALKVLHAHLASDPVKLKRFVREARLMMRLHHPNVVRFYDIFEDGEHLVLAMEYVEGCTLTEWCERQGEELDESALACVFVDILRGLASAHRGGIVHRDLKPANVLVTYEDGRHVAKIIDFGVARSLRDAPAEEDHNKIVGTAAYISPEEVAEPDLVGPASDLYSLGVMLYEAACGSRPFTTERVEGLLDAHVYNTPPRPRELNPNVTPAFESVILRTLEKHPEDRFGSAPEMINALELALQGAVVMPREAWVRSMGAGVMTTEWHRSVQDVAKRRARPQLGAWLRRGFDALFTMFTSTGMTGGAYDPHHLNRAAPELPWG